MKNIKNNIIRIRRIFERVSAIFAGLFDGRNNTPSDKISFSYEDVVSQRATTKLASRKALLMKKYKNHYEREAEKAQDEITRISVAKTRKQNEQQDAYIEKTSSENSLNSFGDEQIKSLIYQNIGEAEEDIEQKQTQIEALLKQYKSSSSSIIGFVKFWTSLLGYWFFLILLFGIELPFNIWAFKVKNADSTAIFIALGLGITIPFVTHFLGETITQDKEYQKKVKSYFISIGILCLFLLVAILALVRGVILSNTSVESGIKLEIETQNKVNTSNTNSNINIIENSQKESKEETFKNSVIEMSFFFVFQSLLLSLAIKASTKYHNEESKEGRNIKLAIWEEKRKLKKDLKLASKKLKQSGKDYQKFQTFYESLITTKNYAQNMLDDIDIAELYEIEEKRINDEKLELITDYKRANLWTRKDLDSIPSNWKTALPKNIENNGLQSSDNDLVNKQKVENNV